MPNVSIKVYDREVVGVQNKLYNDTFIGRDLLCDNDEMIFHEGRIYGIWSHCGGGGQAISQLLTGKTPVMREDICIDGRRYAEKKRVEEGWMMGEGIEGITQPSIKDQIIQSLKKADLPFYWMDVVKKFDLSEDNLKKKLNAVGDERWRASAAIGYANGKKLFCFPWLNYVTLKESVIMGAGFWFYANVLREAGATIILPSDNRQILQYITDEVINLKNPRFEDWDVLYDYMRDNDFLGKFEGEY